MTVNGYSTSFNCRLVLFTFTVKYSVRYYQSSPCSFIECPFTLLMIWQTQWRMLDKLKSAGSQRQRIQSLILFVLFVLDTAHQDIRCPMQVHHLVRYVKRVITRRLIIYWTHVTNAPQDIILPSVLLAA